MPVTLIHCTCSTVAGSMDCSLEAFSYSSSLLLPAPSSGSGLGPPPPPPATPRVPPPATPPEQVACRRLLLKPGPEQQLPMPLPQPTPPDSSPRPPATQAIPPILFPSTGTAGEPEPTGGGEACCGRELDSFRLSSRDEGGAG